MTKHFAFLSVAVTYNLRNQNLEEGRSTGSSLQIWELWMESRGGESKYNQLSVFLWGCTRNEMPIVVDTSYGNTVIHSSHSGQSEFPNLKRLIWLLEGIAEGWNDMTFQEMIDHVMSTLNLPLKNHGIAVYLFHLLLGIFGSDELRVVIRPGEWFFENDTSP